MHTVADQFVEEERAFLQSRLGTFGAATGAAATFFWVFRLVGIRGQWAHPLDPSMNWHLAAALPMLAMALVCWRTRLSVRVLRGVELVAIGATVVALELMASSLPLYTMPEYILLVALVFTLFARTVFVPSSGTHTAVLCTVVGIAYVAFVYLVNLGIDLEAWARFDPSGYANTTPEVVAASKAVYFAAQWTLNAAVMVLASRVLYGLRREVRDARQLGQYRLVRKLGEGGMGAVYQARHATLRRPTAVKLLPPDKARPNAIERFEREVQLTAGLSHPNTVSVFDYGRTPDGVFYYAMELIKGATLGQIVEATGPMPEPRAVHVLLQAAGALVEAHAVGLIHRDIKPANIMLHSAPGVADTAKVLDFGLVKEIEAGDDGLTVVGTLTGTPLYLAPEAIRDPEAVDARTDLYALGAVAYYLVTGEHVFTGGSVIEICTKHLHDPPVPPSERTGHPVEPALEALVLRCLEKSPHARPADAAALVAALQALDIPPWRPRDAQAWWEEYGPALDHHFAAAHTPELLTVDIGRLRDE